VRTADGVRTATAPARAGGAMKSKRQQAILALVSSERLASQEEIRARLRDLGLQATQSTISRDIEELGLARVHDHDGVRYVASGDAVAPATPVPPMSLLRRMLEEFALSLTAARNILVIRTSRGAANALAECVDRAELAGIAGTVAGDDTIFVVAQEGVTARELEGRMRQLMEEP